MMTMMTTTTTTSTMMDALHRSWRSPSARIGRSRGRELHSALGGTNFDPCGATGFGEVLKICCFLSDSSPILPVPATHCCLVDLIDLTLGDEDANSKVDVVTNVEVNVGENVCLEALASSVTSATALNSQCGSFVSVRGVMIGK